MNRSPRVSVIDFFERTLSRVLPAVIVANPSMTPAETSELALQHALALTERIAEARAKRLLNAEKRQEDVVRQQRASVNGYANN